MGTAGIFATYPQPFLSTFGGLDRSDRRHGAARGRASSAITDQRNVAPPAWLAPIAGRPARVPIGVAFGFNAGYAINPARDFGPRLFTAVAGWGGGVFTAGNGWWWVPIRRPDRWRRSAGGFVYDGRPSSGFTAGRGAERDEHVHPRARSGHDLEPRDRLRPRRPRRRRRPSRSSRRSSRRPGTSSTIRRRSGPRSCRRRGRRSPRPASRRRHRGHRRHQPARDDDPLGQGHRQARRQRHRLAEPRHGADLRAAQGRRASRRLFREQDRPGRRRLLLRHEDQAPARHRRRPARARRARRDAVRHRRLVPDLAAHRRQACTSPTSATPAARCSSTSTRSSGTTSCCELLDVPRAMLPEVRPSSEVYGETDAVAARRSRSRSPASPAISRRPRSARPASSRVRRRTPTAPAASCC